MSNKYEKFLPGINLSNADMRDLVKFAEMHNITPGQTDQLTDDSRGEYEKCYYRVTKRETGLRFQLIDTDEGTWMVYDPDIFSDDTPRFSDVCKVMYPYLRIIGLNAFETFYGEVSIFEG